MKSTGICRRVDALGRVVLAKELRDMLGITPGTSLEIFTEGESIVLRKFERGCIFCGEMNGTVEYKEKTICTSCLKELSK